MRGRSRCTYAHTHAHAHARTHTHARTHALTRTHTETPTCPHPTAPATHTQSPSHIHSLTSHTHTDAHRVCRNELAMRGGLGDCGGGGHVGAVKDSALGPPLPLLAVQRASHTTRRQRRARAPHDHFFVSGLLFFGRRHFFGGMTPFFVWADGSLCPDGSLCMAPLFFLG